MEKSIKIDRALRVHQAFVVHWIANMTNAQSEKLAIMLHEYSIRYAKESCEVQLSCIERYKRNLKGFGRDPNRYRISSDALLRRCKKDGGMSSILPMIDANNVLSLGTGWPVGCYDLLAINGKNILHRLGIPGECMETLGKGTFDVEGLPVLCDDHGSFGSTISDSLRTRIKSDSLNGLYVVYGFGEVAFEALSTEIERVMALAGFAMPSKPTLVR